MALYLDPLRLAFRGQALNFPSIHAACIHMAGGQDSAGPKAGGTLTVNGESLGSYDYVVKDGDQTISAFTASDWFTSTADSRAAIIVVKGDLTINTGQTLIPSVRKLFVAIYVTGTLTINGGVSMSARGANHSAATGSNIAAAAIRIINGTHDGVSNPQVPAAGANGGAGLTSPITNTIGATGSAGTDGATGGGGSGACYVTGRSNGAGAPGTSFGGGPGSGATDGSASGNTPAAGVNGGAGSTAPGTLSANRSAGGGAGNPPGTNKATSTHTSITAPEAGTGGVLVIMAATLAGSGAVTAKGSVGGIVTGGGGGSSGGGSITVLYGTDTSTITPNAAGGAAAASFDPGGAGGAGTARKLQRAA